MSATTLRGRRIVAECREHVLWAMAQLDSCRPTGDGARQKDIIAAAGFGDMRSEIGPYFTRAILHDLEAQGFVEFVGEPKRCRIRSSRHGPAYGSHPNLA